MSIQTRSEERTASLDPEVKAKWCAALRSGNYEQGRGLLHDESDNTFCCLGVLQQITGLPQVDSDMEYLDYGKAAAIGLSIDAQTELSDLNDDGYTFEEIAAYIEGTL